MTQKEFSLTLENLKLRLQVLESETDIEEAHHDADSILVETVKFLATAQFGSVPDEVAALLRAYYNVPKWYA